MGNDLWVPRSLPSFWWVPPPYLLSAWLIWEDAFFFFPSFFFFFFFLVLFFLFFFFFCHLCTIPTTLQSPGSHGRSIYTYPVPQFLHLVTWFLQLPPREHSLIPWLWRLWACVPGSHRTVTIRDSVLGRLPPPGCCTDSRQKHIYSLSEKEAYLLVQNLWPVEQASSLVLLQLAMEGLSGSWWM